MNIITDVSGFEWDEANRNKNWIKHRVSWQECEEIFFNYPVYSEPDELHSQAEERFFALGKTNASRLLVVVFTKRSSAIRVISARDMNKKERTMYHEKVEKDTKV